MALKAIIKSLDEVSEGFRELYTQVGDEFVLDVDGGEYKSRLSEFRDNNLDLTRKLEASGVDAKTLKALKDQLKTFDGLDPEKAREAIEQAQLLEDKKLIDAGKIDEVVAQRTDRMRGDFEGKIDALIQKNDQLSKDNTGMTEKLTAVVIDNALQQVAGEVGSVRSGAMQDILSRGRKVWSLDDKNTPVPRDSAGKTMYGKDGETVLTMKEWAGGLLNDASYLFEGSAGSGGQGSGGGGEGSKRISAGDQDSLNSNIESIATGEVQVG